MDYRLQKPHPNRLWITVGWNLIKYQQEVTTWTADLVTAKTLFSSVVCTTHATYDCAASDMKNFYLNTEMDVFQWNLSQNYSLMKTFNANKKWIHLHEIRKDLYRLPQAFKLANQLVKKWLSKHSNTTSSTYMLFLWKHYTQPIRFTVVVDDFGIKYVNKKDSSKTTEWKSIGLADYIAVSHLNGTTKMDILKYLC